MFAHVCLFTLYVDVVVVFAVLWAYRPIWRIWSDVTLHTADTARKINDRHQVIMRVSSLPASA